MAGFREKLLKTLNKFFFKIYLVIKKTAVSLQTFFAMKILK